MVEVVGTGVRAGSWREYDEPQLSEIQRGALEAFREQGYHGTSVRDIARRVGVTVPALYYHFENKQAIFVSLLETSMADFLWRVRAADEEAGDDVRDDILSALLNLGYQRGSVEKVLDGVMRRLEVRDFELLLREVLKELSRP